MHTGYPEFFTYGRLTNLVCFLLLLMISVHIYFSRYRRIIMAYSLWMTVGNFVVFRYAVMGYGVPLYNALLVIDSLAVR